ncbi:hypothetical protein AMECASPLE_018750 [Ameca splendens]|uniref:Immunoglobulin domain-containing protein n=1 Tax=Ameca splendens TaxID=208324 RepID=A0ABV1A978_9TELE
MNFTLIGALLCMFSWISTSVCQFRTVMVQPGEKATLRCSNLSSFPTFLHWFKLAHGPNASLILSMKSPERNGLSSNKVQLGRFTMSSNITDLFLNIKTVGLSDAGLYFCGTYTDENPGIFSATYLQVKDVFDEVTNVPAVIMGAVTLSLVLLIICLAAKIVALQRAPVYTSNQLQNENQNSDKLNYAAPRFRPKAQSNRRPVAERELETTTVYAATR